MFQPAGPARRGPLHTLRVFSLPPLRPSAASTTSADGAICCTLLRCTVSATRGTATMPLRAELRLLAAATNGLGACWGGEDMGGRR